MHGRVLFRITRSVIAWSCGRYWRVRIDGSEHVPADGAFILAPIHRSNVDFIPAAMVTRRRVRFLAKHTLWRYRPLGRLLGTLGAIPVERGTADRAALRAVEDVLRGGEPIIIFPEGTRQAGPAVGPLFDGVAYLSQRTGVPILPVGIAGSEEAMPPGSRFIAPARVSVCVGPAVLPWAALDRRRVSRRDVRDQTAALADALQAAYDSARRARDASAKCPAAGGAAVLGSGPWVPESEA